MQFSGNTIQFSHKLSPNDLQSNWNVGETYDIEFYKGEFTPVHLINANSDLIEYLQQISLDRLIFFDIKSVQPHSRMSYSKPKKIIPVSLFSFYCSSGVYIFKQIANTPNG